VYDCSNEMLLKDVTNHEFTHQIVSAMLYFYRDHIIHIETDTPSLLIDVLVELHHSLKYTIH
jgi:hypothetical protein